MNQITEVKLTLANDEWKIEVTKEFSPEYGGGSQVFTRSGGSQIHEALRRAAEMVTLTPTRNRAHPFVASPANGLCSSCGQLRTAAIHDWEPPTSHDYDAEGNPRRGGALMDPDSNLKEQLELVQAILDGTDSGGDTKLRLAELIDALDTWICNGGFLPERWRMLP